jgi:hypothetical protein
MTPREFCYWLQGFFEVVQPKSLTKEQVTAIKEKLDESLNKPDEAQPTFKTSASDLESLSHVKTYC